MKKLLFFFVLLLPLYVFASEGFLIGDTLPDAPLLAKRGDFEVGVRTIEVVNKNQLNVLAYTAENQNPRYDRRLKLEIWYPAVIPSNREAMTVYADEWYTSEAIIYQGRALRNAEPVQDKFPLIIVSHGYPGTRYIMSYLTENLASKGYIVAAIDHTESTVMDQNKFSSTLLNRSLDILFVLDQMAAFSEESSHFLHGRIDAENTGLIGYSMGGYGIINAAGGGYSQQGVDLSWGVPGGHLSIRQAGNAVFEETRDPRIKAIFAMAPWGAATFWDAETMKGLTVPMFLVAGDYDDVAGFENGIKLFFDWAIHSDRYMLVFKNARHNLATNAYGEHPLVSMKMTADDILRYGEPAWDKYKVNNIVQHFATAFFGIHLKNLDYAAYLDLIEKSNDGVWSQNKDGSFKENHTHWLGFPNRAALGMELYHHYPE
jgi:predicted dienelactone hydrolase